MEMDLGTRIAARLHEEWRETRKKADGTYEPRWKKVTDKKFVAGLDVRNLPPYLRLDDHHFVEIDIANTPYEKLSPDWQAENKAAGKVVAEIIESKKLYSRDEIGTIIHDEWLKRNSWAKSDPILGKDFIDLPEDEQDKDLVQYDIGIEAYQEMLKEIEEDRENS